MTSRVSLVILHTQAESGRCNRRSLSGMGLTRERWCCAGGWLSKLDMNTCQTDIKTGILLMYLGNLDPGYQRNNTPRVVPSGLNRGG